MPEVLKVKSFDVKPGAHSGTLVLWSGDKRFKEFLQRAFPSVSFTSTFSDLLGKYDWGSYAHGLGDSNELSSLLSLLSEHLTLMGDFDECHALDYHGKSVYPYQRTSLGELLYAAKSYGGDGGSREKAEKVSSLLVDFINSHPRYRRATAIIPVPSSDTAKSFDLTDFIAERIAVETSMMVGRGWVKRVRETRQQKNVHTEREKVENVQDAFELHADVSNQRVIVLDDLYQSGATINEVGRTIRTGGPVELLGLVATKTLKDV